MTRTIDSATVTVYDASAFYGSSTFLSQNKTAFRNKGSLYNTGFGNS